MCRLDDGHVVVVGCIAPLEGLLAHDDRRDAGEQTAADEAEDAEDQDGGALRVVASAEGFGVVATI